MNPRSKAVRAVLDESVARINLLPGPVFREMLPLVVEAHRDVTVSLSRWLANENGANRFTAQRHRNLLANLNEALSLAKHREPALLATLQKGGAVAASVAATNIVSELEHFSAVFEGSTIPVAFDIAGAVKSGRALLFKEFETSAKRYSGSIGRRVTDLLTISRLKGQTVFELSRTLEKHLPSVFAGDRSDCMRLARSETMNAYNLTHMDAFNTLKKDDDTLLLRWDASYDSRRCHTCASLDGQTADPAKGETFLARYRMGTVRLERPPAHPSCRCVVSPWREAWAKYARTGDLG